MFGLAVVLWAAVLPCCRVGVEAPGGARRVAMVRHSGGEVATPLACLYACMRTPTRSAGPEGVLDRAAEAWEKHRTLKQTQCGIAFRTCEEILAAKEAATNVRIAVSAEYVEIYQGRITCLACGRAVQLRDCRILQGALQTPLRSMRDVITLLREGQARKRFAATAMNERSSRAHTVLVISLEQTNLETSSMMTSKLFLADLAGCEQIKQSKVEGQRKVEARWTGRRGKGGVLGIGRVMGHAVPCNLVGSWAMQCICGVIAAFFDCCVPHACHMRAPCECTNVASGRPAVNGHSPALVLGGDRCFCC